jgi:hypothetical protein
MTHSKNAPKEKIARKDDEKPIGYKSSGGRMGAESLARKTWVARSPRTMKPWAVKSRQADLKPKRAAPKVSAATRALDPRSPKHGWRQSVL